MSDSFILSIPSKQEIHHYFLERKTTKEQRTGTSYYEHPFIQMMMSQVESRTQLVYKRREKEDNCDDDATIIMLKGKRRK